ncbi:GNAT family N-acetyltransferase [Sediminivirga luteola]|uniref:GNAT family N-acetyltransferase n=1 Tax=Sediminivirga luteola TaxID=1774748 RepID=UPI001F5698C4|nr:GNAT family N-acetyltransferase [Sediminivirga luteola]
MSTPRIRPFAEGDDLRLNELLSDPRDSAVHAGRGLLRPPAERPLSRAVVAEVADGVLVGAAGVSESLLHPQRAWVHVDVAAAEARSGLGGRLLEAVRAELAGTRLEGLGLRCVVTPGSAGEAFAREHGFSELHRTRMVRIDAGALPSPALEGRPDGAELKVTTAGSAQLTLAYGPWYQRVYARIDPAVELSVGEVHRRFLSEQAGAHGAALVLRDGAVQAFAVSYARPQEAPAGEGAAPVPQPEEAGDDGTELTIGTADTGTAEDLELMLGVLAAERPVVVEVKPQMELLDALADRLIDNGRAQVLTTLLTLGD